MQDNMVIYGICPSPLLRMVEIFARIQSHSSAPLNMCWLRGFFVPWGKCLFFKKDFLFIYLFIFRVRRREGEREREKHQCVVASCRSPTGDLACNPGMCPDWKSNQWPFASQSGAQPTEPHQPGLRDHFYSFIMVIQASQNDEQFFI